MSSHPDPPDHSHDLKKISADIELAAKSGDFETAEALRDKLLEAHPMAISEAIAAAEVIENEMTAAIDKDHLAIWSELYDRLTTEERNCIFHSMKRCVLPEKKVLLKYGSLNNKLFFIEKGKVTACLPQKENKHKVIARLERGDVLGEYSFATIALCSATAVTATEVELLVLDGQQAEDWEKKHPGLYNKILEFCKKHGQIDQISARKEKESAVFPRYTVEGRVRAVLLDKEGNATKVHFVGDVEEISRSGCSFTIRCNNRATVRKLLAQAFSLSFSCPQNEQNIEFSCAGRVIRVSFLLYTDYILHMAFPTLLPEDLSNRLAK